jgi:hypothetical protein
LNQVLSSLVDQEVGHQVENHNLGSDELHRTYAVEEFEVRILEPEKSGGPWQTKATIPMQSSENALTVRVVTLLVSLFLSHPTDSFSLHTCLFGFQREVHRTFWCLLNHVSSFWSGKSCFTYSTPHCRIQILKRMKLFWPLGLLTSKGKMLLQEDVCFYFLLGRTLIILKIWYFLDPINL